MNQDLSDRSTSARPKRLWWILAVVVCVGIAVVVFAFARQGEFVAPSPGASATATASGTSTATGPSETPTPTASVQPTKSIPTVRAKLKNRVEMNKGVTARVTSIQAVTGTARGPGEIAGPALRVTVEVTNRSPQKVDLSMVVVNLYYGSKHLPASTLSGPNAAPFSGTVASGSSAKGTYVFNVPVRERKNIQIEFRYSTEASVAIFEGAV